MHAYLVYSNKGNSTKRPMTKNLKNISKCLFGSRTNSYGVVHHTLL